MHQGYILNSQRPQRPHLLFLNKRIIEHEGDNGSVQEEIQWKSADESVEVSFEDANWPDSHIDSSLVVIDEVLQEETHPRTGACVFPMTFHAVENTEKDWNALIRHTLDRASSPRDKFWMRELIWFLNWRDFDGNILKKIISQKDSYKQILALIAKISVCLAPEKQKNVKAFLNTQGIGYITKPVLLLENALKVSDIKPEILYQFHSKSKNKNLFEWVDFVYQTITPNSQQTGTDNIWIQFCYWMKTDSPFYNYSKLTQIIPLVSESVRFLMLKRYFHDVRLKNTSFDEYVIEQFRNSDYADFIRYRECIQTPGAPVDLTVPMLADNILTFIRTRGTAFQTFEGMLDYAIQNSDVTNPSVTFDLKRFLPICEGGAVYNKENFKGFIRYDVICEIDEEKFTEDNLNETIQKILKRCNAQKKFVCSSMGQYMYDYNAHKCMNFHCDCIQRFDGFWWLYDDNVNFINAFLKDKQIQKEENKRSIIEINQSNFSHSELERNIKEIAQQYKKIDEKRFVIPSSQYTLRNFETWLILQYSYPLSIRFFPLTTALIGERFDVFGIKQKIQHPIDITIDSQKKLEEEYKKRESAEVYRRIVYSLSKDLGIPISDDNFFEIPYDRKRLKDISGRYYYNLYMEKSSHASDDFLTSQHTKQYSPFCAPQIGSKRNETLDLPYYWCIGLECFHNKLDSQKIDSCLNWKDYTLYHLMEIIGHPMLKKTEIGYEAKKCIQDFIGMANNAIKKFKRLKCRDCGHLLFVDKVNGYNRYNHFACQNAHCQQYLKPVYLNFCHQCKKGLIDSRDSARCPNGWYICPTCLSCCTDQQYERLAQRYIIEGNPVPEHIKSNIGQGHNDKNDFFCWHCGTQLLTVTEGKSTKTICPNCGKDFSNVVG